LGGLTGVGNVDFTQLGVNNANAIWSGGLYGNSKFFGSSTAETVSNTHNNGSWNTDDSFSVNLLGPWSRNGNQAPNGQTAGVFAFSQGTGGVNNTFSHRTILSGY
jgi:hypothetical protein